MLILQDNGVLHTPRIMQTGAGKQVERTWEDKTINRITDRKRRETELASDPFWVTEQFRHLVRNETWAGRPCMDFDDSSFFNVIVDFCRCL